MCAQKDDLSAQLRHLPGPGKAAAGGGVPLGRASFARISAVKGTRLTPKAEALFREFARERLSPAERRTAIARTLGKARS